MIKLLNLCYLNLMTRLIGIENEGRSYETALLYGYLKRYILLFEKGAPVKPKTKIGFTPVESSVGGPLRGIQPGTAGQAGQGLAPINKNDAGVELIS